MSNTSNLDREPRIVGIGGTPRPNSTTERALRFALRAAEERGARTRLLGGEFLASLPIFDPAHASPSPEQLELLTAIGEADGVIVASPGYHGSISGLIKNALDTLEFSRTGDRPYFESRPVGLIVTVAGPQAAGTTLTALRSIIHALRGWPTPLGASLNTTTPVFDEAGACQSEKDGWQLTTVAEQVVSFLQPSLRHDVVASGPSL